MKPIIPLLSVFMLAGPVYAECPSKLPTQVPAVPDGSAADADSMLSAQAATGAYVRTIEAYLDCWAPLLSAPTHNRLVDLAEKAAESYNTELLRFRQREDIASRS